MKKAVIIVASIILILVVMFNITKPSQPSVSGETNSNPELLFFWLPSGAPCQAQDKILMEIENEESYKNIKFTRVDITQNSSSTLLNKYGIRSVPTIIIVNNQGKIHKQFTPGIQTKEVLQTQLNQVLA